MNYIPTEHRFASEAAYLAALAAAGLDVTPNRYIALDVIGLMPGRTDWHVNMSRREDVPIPASFAGAALIVPATPSRGWCGLPVPAGDPFFVVDAVPLSLDTDLLEARNA